MGVKELPALDGPALVAALSSPFEDDRSLVAARFLMEMPNPEPMLSRLYPRFLRQKTITNALRHLRRAGADLRPICIPMDLFASSYPLNRILPPPPTAEPGQVSLAAIEEALQAHAGHLDGVLAGLTELGGDGDVIVGKGQGYRVRYPDYPRFSNDADVFVQDREVGGHLLGELSARGFAIHGCRIGPVSVVKTFRHIDGHEINVGVHVGGTPSDFASAPLRSELFDRAGPVDVDGRSVMACGPEDLLLSSVLRPVREGFVSIRGLNDVRYLLHAESGTLDWDYLENVARGNGLVGALGGVVRAAERTHEAELTPRAELGRFRPGALERRLFAVQVGSGPATARTLAGGSGGRRRKFAAGINRTLWQLRFVSARLGRIHGPVHAAIDRVEFHAFDWEIRLRRSGRAAAKPLAATLRLLRPRFRSACELRTEPAPDQLGFCLSRARRQPTADPFEATIVRNLPDRGEEQNLRKRTTTGRAREQPHRCEGFVVARLRATGRRPAPSPR